MQKNAIGSNTLLRKGKAFFSIRVTFISFFLHFNTLLRFFCAASLLHSGNFSKKDANFLILLPTFAL
ncbi:MAG: hypothetical protein RI894_1085 [Bacteroidota bacterium]|jgi:hypothetical protein